MIINNLLLTPEKIINEVFHSFEKDESLLLTYLNQHCFNIYYKNKKYRELLDKYFKVYQADAGVFLFLKYLKRKKISRIDATAMNTDILKEIIKRKIPVAFIGGRFSDSFIETECKKREINFAGYYNGYFYEKEISIVLETINHFPAKIYFIGMGVPKQEFFAYELSKYAGNKIIICTGNFLEFYLGTIKRAPLVIQKSGLEWLFRLITEPRRLWKRYIIGIPEFLYRVLIKY